MVEAPTVPVIVTAPPHVLVATVYDVPNASDAGVGTEHTRYTVEAEGPLSDVSLVLKEKLIPTDKPCALLNTSVALDTDAAEIATPTLTTKKVADADGADPDTRSPPAVVIETGWPTSRPWVVVKDSTVDEAPFAIDVVRVGLVGVMPKMAVDSGAPQVPA